MALELVPDHVAAVGVLGVVSISIIPHPFAEVSRLVYLTVLLVLGVRCG